MNMDKNQVNWSKYLDQAIPEKSAKRIFGAADKILKAGALECIA